MINPKTPYFVDHTPRQVDKTLPFLKRMGSKLNLIWLDFSDYATDFIFWRPEQFSYKTAYFVKRNGSKMAHKLHHIWDELKKVGRGFKMLNEDLKFFLRL